MRVILTGSTGFIGNEILIQCISHTFISHVYVLTRRPLDERFSHKKITQLLHEDFERYPEELLGRLREEGVEACIWALGGKVNQFKDIDEARKVGISYPIQAAESFAKHLATGLAPWPNYPKKKTAPPKHKHFPFRFIFISGWGAEQNQFRTLWMYSESRKIKGAAEKGLNEVAQNSQEIDGHKCFEVISLRPGGVLAAGENLVTIATEAVMPSVTVDRLARTAIRCSLGGADGKKVVENKECLGDDWAMINFVHHT